MHNNFVSYCCGRIVVLERITNQSFYIQLCAALFAGTYDAGYKPHSLTTAYSPFVRSFSTRSFRVYTTVTQQFIPIIHSTNKDYKNFLFKNYLIIKREVVHT